MKTNLNRNKIINIVLLLVLPTLIFTVGLYQYINGSVPFIPGYDVRFQHRPFYSEFLTLITNSLKFTALPFWSWNHFFGNNYWAAKVVSVLGDPYNYLTLWIDQHYYVILLIQFYLKILVSALAFLLYGSTRKWKIEIIIIGSLMFAFSSWMIKYTEQPMFISFYSLIPFYFLTIELFFQNKSKYLFPFIVAILIITNYYLFFALSFFTIIYVIYRCLEEKVNIKKFFNLVFILIFYYLIGVLLSSFIILPALDFILENTRINGVLDSRLFHTDPRIVLHLIIGIFIPSNTFISGINNIFETNHYPTREILLWSSSLTGMLLFQTAFAQDRWYRNLNRIFILVIILIMSPIGGSILNGFNYTSFRWTFLFIFMAIMISMQFLNSHRVNLKILYLNFAYYILGIILIISLLKIDIKLNSLQIIVSFITLLFMISYAFILEKGLNLRYLVGLLVFELAISLFITFQTPYFNQMSWDDVNNSESVLGNKNELMDFLYQKQGSYSFFRVYAPFDTIYWYSSLNMNLIYGTMDIKTYDSTYQPSTSKLREIADIQNHIDWYFDISNPYIVNIGSVKYAVVTNESELPHDDFVYYTTYKGLDVYLNLKFQSFLRTYTDVMSINQYLSSDSSLIERTIIADESDVLSIKNYLKSSENYSAKNEMIFQNMIIAEIENVDSSFAVTSIAYDKGWRVTVNEKQVDIYDINGGFIGFNIPAGGGTVKMYFMPNGFKVGVIISLISFSLLILLFLSDKKIKV